MFPERKEPTTGFGGLQPSSPLRAQGSPPPATWASPPASGGLRATGSTPRAFGPTPPMIWGALSWLFGLFLRSVLGSQLHPETRSQRVPWAEAPDCTRSRACPRTFGPSLHRGLCAGGKAGRRCPAGVSPRATASFSDVPSLPGSGRGMPEDQGWTSGVSSTCCFRPVCGQRGLVAWLCFAH